MAPKKKSIAEAGFTLLEVVIAMMLVGIGFALALSAMSGSIRLSQRALEYDNAMLLARSKLEEVFASPDYEVIEETSQEAPDVYGGVAYSYRIEVNPISVASRDERKALKNEMTLNEINIVVHWGGTEETVSRTYELTAYRLSKTRRLQGERDEEGGEGGEGGEGNTGGSGTDSAAQGSGGSTPTGK